MIQALLSWAVDHWHELESKVTLLTLARVDGPSSVLDLPARSFLALLEGVVRDNPGRYDVSALDALYEQARAAKVQAALPVEEKRSSRNAEIDRLARMFS